jgi:hypothetical protein
VRRASPQFGGVFSQCGISARNQDELTVIGTNYAI